MNDSEHISNLALQNLDMGIIILCQDKKVRRWNKWMELHSSYLEKNIINQNLNELFPGLYPSRISLAIDNTLQFSTSSILSNALNYHTLPLHHADNKELPLEQMLLLKPLKIHNKQFCMIEIFDVSNAVTREALLRKKAMEAEQGLITAQSLSQVKSEFVSTVSHELRTPLTAIKAAIDLIQFKTPDEVKPLLHEMISIASRNSSRLLNLINDLLDMEKIEAGKMEYNFQPVDIQVLLEHVIQDTIQFAFSQDIHLELVNNDCDFKVNADEKRLTQVIVNLLSNAIKFSTPGQTISVESTINGHQAEISVIDNGPGISGDMHEYIFDKFTQVDSSDTRKVPGTGLGLSISRAIVETHNGILDFESEPNIRTRFYILLPILEH